MRVNIQYMRLVKGEKDKLVTVVKTVVKTVVNPVEIGEGLSGSLTREEVKGP